MLFTHVYAQIDGVEKEKKETGSTGVSTHSAAYSSLDMSKSWEMAKPDTHLYDQVDKGKKGEVDILDTVQVLVVMGSHQPVQTPPPAAVFCLMVSSPHSLD